IHLEADSTTQEFKLYNGKAVLKKNVFILDFVPDQGTADSNAIVIFTTWSHPPDLDLDFSPGGFWYSHTIPEAERTRALAAIHQTTAAGTAAATSISAAAKTTATTSTSVATETTTAPTLITDTTPTPAQQLTPAPRNVHRSANIIASFYSNSERPEADLPHQPFVSHHNPSAPAYAPLEKVYSDILYTRESGQGAYNYVITFIDAATRYVWHLNLPIRDMAFEAFVAWLPVA
ncbi:unnamed protein product, partial [Closterium sp. NIES-54]